MPTLHFLRGNDELFVHVLRGGRTLIGRSDRCDIALPSDSISRTHCMIDQRPDGFYLVDRSRHGTLVNGEPAHEQLLADGDVVAIGAWRARYDEKTSASMSGKTATMPMLSMAHEELLEIRDDAVAYVRARIVFEGGPRDGEAIQIDRSRVGVGGKGSAIELDPHLPMNAMFARVVRGRPMVEPGHGAAFLEDQRVREITPVLPGEVVRIGDVQFRLEPYTVEESGKEREGFGAMVGSTPQMRKLFGTLMRMAAHDAPVLLTGESGTGKELAAQGLHEAGPRAEGPFVAINCAAVADTLFESELFGHEKGAFTGATARADGAFQRADGGTLFLDVRRGPARRRPRAHLPGRPRGRGHQPPPPLDGPRGHLPAGPVLPPRGAHRPSPSPAGAPRRHPRHRQGPAPSQPPRGPPVEGRGGRPRAVRLARQHP